MKVDRKVELKFILVMYLFINVLFLLMLIPNPTMNTVHSFIHSSLHSSIHSFICSNCFLLVISVTVDPELSLSTQVDRAGMHPEQAAAPSQGTPSLFTHSFTPKRQF